MLLSRTTRVFLVVVPLAAVGSAVVAPAAHATPPVVYSTTGVALVVGDVVAFGTPTGDDLCAFAGGSYVAPSDVASVRTTVTDTCTLVIAAIERTTAKVSGLPDGGITPKQPRDGAGSPALANLTETASTLPHPDRYERRLAWIMNTVYDEALQPVFEALDEFTFFRNLTTGELGPPTYRSDTGYCKGRPYVAARSPITSPLDLPFRNTVTECTYEFPVESADFIAFKSWSGYRQTAPVAGPAVKPRASFTVMNYLGISPDYDLNLDNDYEYLCPVVEGELPPRWYVDCKAREIEYAVVR